jgi:hypothetical protein
MKGGIAVIKKILRTTNSLVGMVLAVLTVVAIVQQVRLPAEERTWQGMLLGIPYDFRPPTPERLRAALWNKDTSSIFVPHVFGLGWTINLYPLFHPRTAFSL